MSFDRNFFEGKAYRGSNVDLQRIKDFIEAGYESKARNEVVHKKSYAPSSIGYDGNGRCPRWWKLAFEGKHTAVDKNDNLGRAVMENGTAVGERFANNMQRAGAPIDAEVEIKIEDPPIRGYIDVLLYDEDGGVTVIEVKSIRPEGFHQRVTTMSPIPYHRYQILLYMRAMGTDRGVMAYEDKGTQKHVLIPITPTKDDWKMLDYALDWLRMVNDLEELPKRPFTRKSKQCKSCPLMEVCWDEIPEGIVEVKPMEISKK